MQPLSIRGPWRTPSSALGSGFGLGPLLVLALSLGGARPVAAQSARNPAQAQALFQEAQRLMKAKDYAQACPKLEASYELEPGGGTLLNLAACYEKADRLSLAWSTFKEALVAARRDGRSERAEFAREHVEALEARLVYLQVGVSPAARVPGLVVEVDGEPLAPAAWGVELPVDPGQHVVRAEAPGKRPYEHTLDVSSSAGTREVFEVPSLEPAESARGESAGAVSSDDGAAPLVRGSDADESGVEDTSGGSSASSTVGWVLGAAGVVSLGVGGYFGLQAMSSWDDRGAGCVGGCTEAAKAAGDDAKDAATLSTIGVGVGIVALGVGAVLILSAPDGDEVARGTAGVTQLSVVSRPGGGELSFRSTW